LQKLIQKFISAFPLKPKVFFKVWRDSLIEISNHFLLVTLDLYKSFLPFTNVLPKPDVIILDPPRSGMHSCTVNDILRLEPEKIVYVSCNPPTQVNY